MLFSHRLWIHHIRTGIVFSDWLCDVLLLYAAASCMCRTAYRSCAILYYSPLDGDLTITSRGAVLLTDVRGTGSLHLVGASPGIMFEANRFEGAIRLVATSSTVQISYNNFPPPQLSVASLELRDASNARNDYASGITVLNECISRSGSNSIIGISYVSLT